MKPVFYEVAGDVVENVQAADFKVQSMVEVMVTLIEKHTGDSDGSFLDSPVVTQYQSMIEEAKKESDNLRADMLKQTVPEDVLSVAGDWKLDYGTGQLMVMVP